MFRHIMTSRITALVLLVGGGLLLDLSRRALDTSLIIGGIGCGLLIVGGMILGASIERMRNGKR